MRKGLWMFAAVTALTAGMTMTSFADWSQQNGRWYYYHDTTGKLVRDEWVESGDKWYYMRPDGVMEANSLIDDTYYVNSNGEMVINDWKLLEDNWDHEGGWRYFGSSGKAYESGWKQIDNVWYHFSDSIMDTGWLDLDGSKYYVGSSGAMATGWEKIADSDDEWGEYWYYFKNNGKMVFDGELSIGGSTYIFDKEGRMLTGWVNPADYTSTGRDNLSGSDINALKYYRSGGDRAEGWLYLASPNEAEENWYYFRNGQAYSRGFKTTPISDRYGVIKIKDQTYCFDEKGRMVTGLVEVEDGKKFYFDPSDGRMMTGRVIVNDENHDNEVFYFTTSGSLGNRGDGLTGVNNGSLYDDGVLVQAEEGMKYAKVTVDGKDYVVNEQGKVKTSGTATDADGVKYKITKKDGGLYQIDVIEE